MEKIHEDPESLPDDVIGFASVHINNKADSAAVVFELRVVQALLGWNSGKHLQPAFFKGTPVTSMAAGVNTLVLYSK
jgi:hypothetical protein